MSSGSGRCRKSADALEKEMMPFWAMTNVAGSGRRQLDSPLMNGMLTSVLVY